MIDANVFARYMTAIADRLRIPLADGTNALYYVALSRSLTTEQFERAADRVFAEYAGFGFPPPAAFLAAARVAPVFEVDSLVRQIAKLGTHHPVAGMVWPVVGAVRDTLGDVVADAYATVGSRALFSDDATTEAVARRDFAKWLREYAAMEPSQRRVLVASPAEARTLAPRNAPAESIASIVTRALPEGTAA
jgi:hypothetical protein